ncbi:MAG: anti-sigma factor antagonist [Deltaproteobacteria bacterium]|nr:MAG: anti-sigma factor antagonist [Deltaproteobacteria bacterium]
MKIKRNEDQGFVIVTLSGRFDSMTAKTVEEKFQTIQDQPRILVNMSGVHYISSAGLRVLLALAKAMNRHQGLLRLCGLTETVREVFDMAGFTQIFQIYNSQEEALEL